MAPIEPMWLVHPALEKLPARRTDASICLEEAVLHLDEGLRLAKRDIDRDPGF